ncbi:hypothetical protein FVE67_02810 [Thermosulfurimonas marina]|uniref:Uncharacterized protein n=1 Tax=Thermosulfurimonas marina TaxID=2047767 RepID=A0A6H1WRL3_9BACT|nr:hypothetical protein [Thermosulfurimonas marina]QJA05794.1 hypothetical protein FVE67_02810 [Thermosulfurimonas marina]
MSKEPFTFKPDPETLRRFREASPAERLEWLEEAWRFILKTVPREKLERWLSLRRGSAGAGSLPAPHRSPRQR